MVGTIELDKDGRHLLIRFDYRDDLVEEVRNLPSRRWDRAQKVWRVPAQHAEHVVSTFMKHGFEVTSDVSSVLAGSIAIPDAPKKPAAGAVDGEVDDAAPLSISSLNERVRAAIQGAFPSTVRVVGEVTDFDKGKDRAHVFFTLVEKDTKTQRAKVDVALFERTRKRLTPILEKAGLEIQDGLEILVEVKVDLYPATGRFQLIVENIEPEFTIGKLRLSREQVLRELTEKKLHQRQIELPWPVPSLRIGVLTSESSDAWNDFSRELESANIGFDVTLCPVRVQGEQLRQTMLDGLQWFAERATDFDLLCIVRGGGSRTDLAWFDDRDVAFAVAQHPLKILCGIGHQRDESVLDIIAHSEKTPTATAARIVTQWRETDAALTSSTTRLGRTAIDRLALADRQLTGLARDVDQVVRACLIGERHRLHTAAQQLVVGTQRYLAHADVKLARSIEWIASRTKDRLGRARDGLLHAQTRAQRAAQTRLERETEKLRSAESRQRLLDPKRVLGRGYVMVQDPATQRILTGIDQLATDQITELRFRDGVATTRIETIRSEQTDGNS